MIWRHEQGVMTAPIAAVRLNTVTDSRISADWLSDDMAHALAAMSPPLDTADVEHAADKLTMQAGQPVVVDSLLRRNIDLLEARRVVEALCALHDLGK
jgi:hypothetical protein